MILSSMGWYRHNMIIVQGNRESQLAVHSCGKEETSPSREHRACIIKELTRRFQSTVGKPGRGGGRKGTRR